MPTRNFDAPQIQKIHNIFDKHSFDQKNETNINIIAKEISEKIGCSVGKAKSITIALFEEK